MFSGVRAVSQTSSSVTLMLASTCGMYGEDYRDFIDMTEGDWVFVPPYMPHVEANMSVTEELVWLTARTPENIVVNLDDVDDSTLEGYRRV